MCTQKYFARTYTNKRAHSKHIRVVAYEDTEMRIREM